MEIIVFNHTLTAKSIIPQPIYWNWTFMNRINLGLALVLVSIILIIFLITRIEHIRKTMDQRFEKIELELEHIDNDIHNINE